MTASKASQLEAIYARVPKIECKGLCQECCGPIGHSREERRRIVKYSGMAPKTTDAMTCVLLDDDGRCRAYAVRPLICRLWGVVESMPCPHGCVPERWLTHEEGRALLREMERVGGTDKVAQRAVQQAMMSAVLGELESAMTDAE